MSPQVSVTGGCVKQLKLLADPTRLAIVELLMDGARCVTDIKRAVQIEPTLLSHHLRVLREGRVLASARAGRSIYYRLSDTVAAGEDSRSLDLGCCVIAFRT